MNRLFPGIVLVLALVLAACQRQAAQEEAAASPAAPPAAAAADDEVVQARYQCDDGNRVEIIRDGRVARVNMSDGRMVRLGAISGSAPPTWADVGLRLVVDGDYVELSQEDGGRSLRCEQVPE
ncbi:hypothetical protein H0E84_18120 [Luteimonas sp. SJ-92]|uniref:C-type lysozyme inhibitor domain-containing protein n=1 Tax=Luteimonas salinisoli TaxID=2752307 RepID=A0A853JHE2_9GAMM|nr:hypothetical protein [Luteimonas salinisoli]NZA28295.1 hypothetical protein [Luteimonas salinisoli]